ncbi:hypothetical protein BC938DRAFT_476563 [Jimgerdemannia flammicorona]|uniref:Golgi apparatus membrane protein TVP23 n=1 Tax=Jimgerdemannia flammicorona TaxID=994334 RepID=A0A433PG51_9FUNG|nr:hypothetical protein BC938DRAFT_476563 [Jimgerdemannia flammicorona]
MSDSRANLLPADDLESGARTAPAAPAPARSNTMASYLEQSRCERRIPFRPRTIPTCEPTSSLLYPSSRSSHPIAVIFFLAFRTGALLTYLFGTLFTKNFALIFVITTLLLAFDFWTVKNVSGRLLVGLRWWNEIREDGTNHWVFESAAPSRKNNPIDSRIFWTVLYVTPLLWVILTLFSLFTLILNPEWLLVIAVALSLNIPNVYAYTQCDSDAKRRWATDLATNSVMGGGGGAGFLGRVVSQGVGSWFSRG